ncbi:hypothetical protein [Candidatus Vesicomyidisocius calyptogenae]|uniref:hypothetical protein n=1 Tax=Vesicomyosocius okutanii subsp. Calyptogena okutanii (strain HA) TaxID=412965 RepID=UPI000317B09C|nr:hypothetical protein [Candidatus Vesicomyosocius okutanii]
MVCYNNKDTTNNISTVLVYDNSTGVVSENAKEKYNAHVKGCTDRKLVGNTDSRNQKYSNGVKLRLLYGGFCYHYI